MFERNRGIWQNLAEFGGIWPRLKALPTAAYLLSVLDDIHLERSALLAAQWALCHLYPTSNTAAEMATWREDQV
jgi:hypothetical protein